MKILIVSTESKLRRTQLLWSSLGKLVETKLEVLERSAYPALENLVRHYDFSPFDRVVVDGNLRRLGRDRKWLRHIPNLVLFEFDFIQNYLPGSPCRGKLEIVLKSLNAHRIVVSSLFIKNDLQSKGFDVAYSPKAFDPATIRHLNAPREIEIGFIGRTKHRAYRQRQSLLEKLRREVGLQTFRTEEGPPYNAALNRLKIFVCPDLGFRELMIKNFEAMAAGCALVTPRLCAEELNCLQLVDLENVVLFDSYEELLAKLRLLRSNPDLARRIAQAGCTLAVSRHSWEHRAPSLLPQLQPELGVPPPLRSLERLRLLFA